MRKLLMIISASILCLGLATASYGQSCEDIHGPSGCAPSPVDGATVTLQGVVYVLPGTYNAGSTYWQCDGRTSGLLFFDAGATDLQEGDLIEVTGVVGAFGDEIQLNNATYTILENDHYAIPMSISTGGLATGGDFFGNFMRVEGILTFVSGSLYEIDDGSGPVDVYIDADTGIDRDRMDQWLGDWVMVQGSTKCYSGAGEMLPRRDTDITLVSVPVQTMSWGSLKSLY